MLEISAEVIKIGTDTVLVMMIIGCLFLYAVIHKLKQ